MDKRKFLTEDGVRKLGRLIYQSRKARDMTLAEASNLIILPSGDKLRQESLGKIEKGYGIPEFNTLVAISAAEFVTDESGRMLTIDDFINIAAELPDSKIVGQSKEGQIFAEMIAFAMRKNGISQELLEQGLYQQLSISQFPIPRERLLEIQKGKGVPPSTRERLLFSMALDPLRECFSLEQWRAEVQLTDERVDNCDRTHKFTEQN